LPNPLKGCHERSFYKHNLGCIFSLSYVAKYEGGVTSKWVISIKQPESGERWTTVSMENAAAVSAGNITLRPKERRSSLFTNVKRFHTAYGTSVLTIAYWNPFSKLLLSQKINHGCFCFLHVSSPVLLL
jgi:hypothetical protein